MLRLLAPAKLNLFLHITGRRDDGYHLLETQFQILDFGDQLSFELVESSGISLETSVESLNTEDNLVMHAAKLLQQKTNSQQGARIILEKKIPMGAGLGGGSSDAATTLLGLNRLWNLEMPTDELAEIGLQLGADVPVFVHGKTAFARGVGEQLEPTPLPSKYFLVVTPQVHVSTAEIFSNPQLTRDSTAIKIPALVAQGGRNDCQKVVEMLHSEVAETRLWLEQFSPAFMSGTGASVFSIFDDELEAREIAAKVPNNWHCFVAKGVNKSPTLEALESVKS